MIHAFDSFWEGIGSSRRKGGIRKGRERLAEMGITDTLLMDSHEEMKRGSGLRSLACKMTDGLALHPTRLALENMVAAVLYSYDDARCI